MINGGAALGEAVNGWAVLGGQLMDGRYWKGGSIGGGG